MSASRVFLISQIAIIVQIITLEDDLRTYAQGKWKYNKSYLQKVREYSKTYIVAIQKNIPLFTSQFGICANLVLILNMQIDRCK